MLDIKFIREHADQVRDAITKKGIDLDLDHLLSLDEQRRDLIQQRDALKAQQNSASDEIAKADGAQKQKLIQAMKDVSDKAHALKDDLQAVENDLRLLVLQVPQLPDPSVPVGGEDANKVVKEVGKPTEFSFEPKDHITLGQELDLIDIERGVKLMGTRGYVLKNELAELEQALLQYALSFLLERGFTQLNVPVLAREEFFEGTGHFPFAEEETFKVYDQKVDRSEPPFYLIGTSEVPLCGYRANEIIEADELPLKYCASTNCFRTEVGSYGKDTQGLYRVKQFQKVEQVMLIKNDPDLGKQILQEILGNAEAFLQSLELPYRVLQIATGDMGAGKVEMYDIETWMPSRQSYGETHSASYLGDWQARRLGLRYREGNDVHFCHTLNNTLVASPRILIPLLENHQQEDGSIYIPQALRPYLRDRSSISRK